MSTSSFERFINMRHFLRPVGFNIYSCENQNSSNKLSENVKIRMKVCNQHSHFNNYLNIGSLAYSALFHYSEN